MRQTEPAVSRSMTFLETMIQQGMATNTARLPSIKELALRAHVGPVAMWKAINRLSEQHILVTSHRKGTLITALIDDTKKTPDPYIRERWQQVAGELTKELVEGHYPISGGFPSSKLLAVRFGVSGPTIRKALASLVVSGVLQRHGTGAKPVPLVSTERQSTIVLICAGKDGQPDYITPRSMEHHRIIESLCAQGQCRLHRIMSYDLFADTRDGMAYKMVESLTKHTGVTGYMVWSVGIGIQQRLRELMMKILSTGRPVALLDEAGHYAFSQFKGDLSRFRHFRLGISGKAGLELGRHLVALGHRRFAFIRPFDSQDTASDVRLAGLDAALAEVGVTNGVRVFHADKGEFDLGQGGVIPVQNLYHALHEFMAQTGPVSTYHDKIAQYGTPATPFIADVAVVRKKVGAIINHREPYSFVNTILEQVISDTSITAWVGPDDVVALLCLDFLQHRGVRVPQEISVAGFDDSPRATLKGLTSYNFGSRAVIHAMMQHLLNIRLAITTRRETPVEIDGFVNARTTTGPVRRQHPVR